MVKRRNKSVRRLDSAIQKYLEISLENLQRFSGWSARQLTADITLYTHPKKKEKYLVRSITVLPYSKINFDILNDPSFPYSLNSLST